MSLASPRSPRRKPRPASPPPLPVYVFIAYGDVASARDAIERVKRMLPSTKGGCVVQPMLWRFDQLANPRWRDISLHEATRAHALVIAMGSAPSLAASTDGWLTALTSRQSGEPINCVVFMRDAEAWTISLQRVEATAARRVAPAASMRPRQKLTVAARAA